MASTTPNLLLPLIAQSQNNKELTLNTDMVGLDEAMCANDTVAMTDADLTLTPSIFLSNIFIKFTGTLSANRHITLPTGSAKWIIVLNDTQNAAGSIDKYALIIRVGTSATVFVTPDANAHLLYSDGVGNVLKVS